MCFFRTTPFEALRTVFTSSDPDQTSSNCSVTRMSTVEPERCLPTEKIWLETETVPFLASIHRQTPVR